MTVFRKKLLINGGVIFTVLLVASVSLYIVIQKFDNIIVEILYYKTAAYTAQQEIKEYSNLKVDSAKADAALLIIKEALPVNDDLYKFRSDMEQLARKRSLRFGFSFSNEAQGDQNTLSSINFNMSTEGDLGPVLDFLKDVESSNYLVEISEFTIKGFGSNMSGQFNGKVFFTKELKNSSTN